MKIPLGKPYIDEEDLKAVREVLLSGWLTQGPKNEEFEKEFSKYIGTKYAVALNSCTSALHLALLAIGVKQGDEVITPSFTFPATANAIVLCGANPVFADIEEENYGISPEDFKEKITNKTKAVIPVHIAGLPCKIQEITEIAKGKNIRVIEDSAEAIGATCNGKMAGSFDIGCFSFYPTKNLTCGEGGMITTNDEEVYNIASSQRAHGMDKSTWAREFAKKPWEKIQRYLGLNYRLTDFQAALGITQLAKLDKMNEMRKRIAAKLDNELNKINGIKPPKVPNGYEHVYQMYMPEVNPEKRDIIVEKLKQKDIGASVHFNPPVHKEPYYIENFKTNKIKLPITDKVCSKIITLPMYPQMTNEELDYLIKSLKEVFQ